MDFILIGVGVVTLVLLIVLIVSYRKDPPAPEPQKVVNPNIECCGAHEICEAETLLTLTDQIIYYNDEELDIYRGTAADDYSQEAIEEFRDVLLTLQLHEVAGWLKSIQLRQIELPTCIREEALMIMNDFREARIKNRNSKIEKTQKDGE